MLDFIDHVRYFSMSAYRLHFEAFLAELEEAVCTGSVMSEMEHDDDEDSRKELFDDSCVWFCVLDGCFFLFFVPRLNVTLCLRLV